MGRLSLLFIISFVFSCCTFAMMKEVELKETSPLLRTEVGEEGSIQDLFRQVPQKLSLSNLVQLLKKIPVDQLLGCLNKKKSSFGWPCRECPEVCWSKCDKKSGSEIKPESESDSSGSGECWEMSGGGSWEIL